VTDDLNQRLAELEQTLRQNQNQIAALTRRIFQLEAGTPPAPEPAEFPPPIHQQPHTESAEPPAPARDWEANVGTNWLNRIGVILLVIGITLFLGFAMSSMGPAGKITIGITAGAALLAAGYWYEHQGNFRPFSLAMIAGGFAILYATTYASHAVEAARIFDNLYIGIALQTLVAAVAIWQSVQFNSERAATLAFLAAYLGLNSSTELPFVYAGCYPLTVGGLWLCYRMRWQELLWGILSYTWFCEIRNSSTDWEYQYLGRPIAWLNIGLFAAFELRERLRQWSWTNPLLIVTNAFLFLVATFTSTRFESTAHVASIFGLFTLASLAASLARVYFNVRYEAASEAITLLVATVWATARFAQSDPLLLLMIVLAIAMLGLARNRMAASAALALVSEMLLAIVSAATFITYSDSKPIYKAPLHIHLALPQTLTLIACLFAAGRWFSATAWPSAAALSGLALVTLITIPKTMGTIVLALEAVLAIAIGLYLARRPIRLGGIALFLFSILKVFVYDLSELDTLSRIFSFIVLGLLLISASWAYTKYRQQLQRYL